GCNERAGGCHGRPTCERTDVRRGASLRARADESRINELIHTVRETVREKITPGTSALFVMNSDAVVDMVHEAFEGQPMELVRTNLSSKQGPSSAARSATELDGFTRTSSLTRPPGLRFRGELARER
ncbi:MAG: DUF1269 domain-containing protein, partial [Chloroflexota bacterium]|nr:DUF1269 domain-containing protein [Chloroflexota bacterium]